MDQKQSSTTGATMHTLHTPSISPTRFRRQEFTDDEVKPLLANLSPAATLDALMSTSAFTTFADHKQAFVRASLDNTSESERVWGIQAALAGKKIREWLDELTNWPWAATKNRQGNSFEGPWDHNQTEAYLHRIETIRDDMETLRVEELKDHVRKAHLKNEAAASVYEKLEDFTAIMTATIVQSLPPLLQLDALLKAWAIRLNVVRRSVPFLRELRGCQESMNSAWMAIGHDLSGVRKQKANFSKPVFLEMQTVLQDQIAHPGQKIDDMLDLLEGSRDMLPEQWIDAVDSLESEYSSWVVKAEELALNNEMRSSVDRQGLATVQQDLREAISGAQHREAHSSGEGLQDLHQLDGAGGSKIAAPFELDIPLEDYPQELINSSSSSESNSEVSRRDSTVSQPSSARSSAEIMRASVATNPGSPVKVSTSVRQNFENAHSKDIRRLLVRRSDSCPSAIPLAPPETFRRSSVGGTSLATEYITPVVDDHGMEEAQATEGAKEETGLPAEASDSCFPPATPLPEKPRSRFEQYEDFAAGSVPVKVQKQRASKSPVISPPQPASKSASLFKQTDKLEARISSILHHIPADIRLKSSGAKTPPPSLPLSCPKTPLPRPITPQFLRKNPPTVHPSLTLAPASEPGLKAQNRSIHDPEIKLYHLQQTSANPNGKESMPVKLYVRLVGAGGERVMVRVGGGWADLGEYLKEYALHHGATTGRAQRSVSDFQITSLPTPGSTSTAAQSTPRSRPGSRPVSRPGSRNEWAEYWEPPSPSPAGFGLGLAGSKAKEVGVEPAQKRLVDDVVAQTQSQTKGPGNSKVGGIKRVFLKRRSTLGEKA